MGRKICFPCNPRPAQASQWLLPVGHSYRSAWNGIVQGTRALSAVPPAGTDAAPCSLWYGLGFSIAIVYVEKNCKLRIRTL